MYGMDLWESESILSKIKMKIKLRWSFSSSRWPIAIHFGMILSRHRFHFESNLIQRYHSNTIPSISIPLLLRHFILANRMFQQFDGFFTITFPCTKIAYGNWWYGTNLDVAYVTIRVPITADTDSMETLIEHRPFLEWNNSKSVRLM